MVDVKRSVLGDIGDLLIKLIPAPISKRPRNYVHDLQNDFLRNVEFVCQLCANCYFCFCCCERELFMEAFCQGESTS